MAKAEAKAKTAGHLNLVPAAPPIIRCRECRHWDSAGAGDAANVATCMLSRRWLPAPMATTDMTTCSKAEAR